MTPPRRARHRFPFIPSRPIDMTGRAVDTSHSCAARLFLHPGGPPPVILLPPTPSYRSMHHLEQWTGGRKTSRPLACHSFPPAPVRAMPTPSYLMMPLLGVDGRIVTLNHLLRRCSYSGPDWGIRRARPSLTYIFIPFCIDL